MLWVNDVQRGSGCVGTGLILITWVAHTWGASIYLGLRSCTLMLLHTTGVGPCGLQGRESEGPSSSFWACPSTVRLMCVTQASIHMVPSGLCAGGSQAMCAHRCACAGFSPVQYIVEVMHQGHGLELLSHRPSSPGIITPCHVVLVRGGPSLHGSLMHLCV